MSVVEIKGIGFPNRGAELLLVATLSELEKRHMRAALEPYSPYHYKVRYPLYTKTSIVIRGVNVLAPLGAMPHYVRDRLGLIRPSEIDLALDASGYAYGDPWAPSLARSRVLDDPSNAPLYLLPQSLGPFKKPQSITTARKLVRCATKIYAREAEGAAHLREATGYDAKIVPDITFGLKVPKGTHAHDVVIIPNFQVLQRRGDSYQALLIEIASKLVQSGRRVTMLNHEGARDLTICQSVVEALRDRSLDCDLVEPTSGTEAKSILGNSQFVLTSRYHGLISALSQATPTAAIGWSYKYEAALSLFDLPVIDAFANAADTLAAIQGDLYISRFKGPGYQSRLSDIRGQVTSMWAEVLD